MTKHLDRGVRLYNEGRHLQAAAFFRRAIASGEDLDRAAVFLAHCLQALGPAAATPTQSPEDDAAAAAARREKSCKPADLYIIGLGVPEKEATSAEAWQAMRRCRALFVNDAADPALSTLHPRLNRIEDLGSGVTSAKGAALVKRVLAAAKREGPVGVAVYGHPMVYEPLAEELVAGAARAGLRCRVVAGVSAADALLARMQLPLGPGEGLHLCDRDFFLRSVPDVRAHLFVCRVTYGGAELDAVVAHCLKHYPASHRVAAARGANWDDDGQVRWAPLSRARRAFAGFPSYSMLVIPPLGAVPR